MPLWQQLKDLAPRTVTVAELSTVTVTGAPVYSTSPSTFDAYVFPGARKVVTREGVEEVSTALVLIPTSSGSVPVSAKLTLPDGRTPRILTSEVFDDLDGQHHIELRI